MFLKSYVVPQDVRLYMLAFRCCQCNQSAPQTSAQQCLMAVCCCQCNQQHFKAAAIQRFTAGGAGTSHHEASELQPHQLRLLQELDRAHAGGVPQQALPSLHQPPCLSGLHSQGALPWLCRQHLWSNWHHPVYCLR